MEGKIRAAIYARVSTADGRQDTENQFAELRRFGEVQGWVIVGEYTDHESGGKAERAELRRMFTDAAQRKYDVVVVWSLDRLTREGVAETFQYIKRLTSHGVQFVSFTEEHFRTTGPAGELMIAVAAWIAKQERTRNSERVRAGLARAKVEGTRSGKPLGRPRVIFNRETVAELKRQGKSWRHIARVCRVGVNDRSPGLIGRSRPGRARAQTGRLSFGVLSNLTSTNHGPSSRRSAY
jgi:DNA invertase Pin-like site-specific DNA recombinase